MLNIIEKNGTSNNEENFKNAIDYIRNSKYEDVKLIFLLKDETIEIIDICKVIKELDFFEDLLNDYGFDYTKLDFDIFKDGEKQYYYISYTDPDKETTVILFR
jgi:hypothetical protein